MSAPDEGPDSPPAARSPRLILASRSPSRAAQLSALGYAFEQATPAFEDPPHPHAEEGSDPAAVARGLAVAKALSLAPRYGGEAVVLAADTIVVAPSGRLVGTPGSADEAFQILRALLGREHRLVSGAAVAHRGRVHEADDTAVVRIADPGPAALAAYVRDGRWEGLAGGYHLGALRSLGWDVVASRDDVGGLPMRVVRPMLEAAGVVPAESRGAG